MFPVRRKIDAHMLSVGMAGVKMGDQIAQIGCHDGGRLGAIAAKVGLSGRAAAVLPDEAAAVRARRGAADAGVLVEIDVAPPTALPLDDRAFDLVIADDTGGLFATMGDGDRQRAFSEALRVLKPGGRVLVIGSVPLEGLSALLSRGKTGPVFDPKPSLESGGFRFVRLLAERDGLRFVEGVKSRDA